MIMKGMLQFLGLATDINYILISKIKKLLFYGFFVSCWLLRMTEGKGSSQGQRELQIPTLSRIYTKTPRKVRFCYNWRRDRDSNPRYSAKSTIDFESTAFDHSAISPYVIGISIKLIICFWQVYFYLSISPRSKKLLLSVIFSRKNATALRLF